MTNPTASRREFLGTLGSLGVLALTEPRALAQRHAAAELKWGYAAITWGDRIREAIDDISALGFAGIQLRANAVQQFGGRPTALRELLESRHLTFVALSSGAVSPDPARERQMIDDHVARARFVHDVGGLYLQVTDDKPIGRAFTAADIARMGKLLTEIGKRTADVGVPLGYHNHLGTIGEKPADVDRILGASDPRYVKFELDIAHYQQGGGNPVDAIRRHHERLLFLHIKDVETLPPDATRAAASYRFVELGRGVVDVRGVLAALDEVSFRGWTVIELDAVPPSTPARTPRECAEISKQYLREHSRS